MRIRNNKVNVFLSDDEKFILKRDSSKLKLSQSEYIRNLIIGYEIKISEVKEEQKPKKDEPIPDPSATKTFTDVLKEMQALVEPVTL